MSSNLTLRTSGLGVLSGILAGFVAGIIARIDMRIVALAAGMRPELTFATLTPIILGVAMGTGLGLTFVFVRRFLPGRRDGWGSKGLVFGAILFMGLVLPMALWQPDLKSELALAPGNLGILLFGSLTVLLGWMIGLVAPILDRRLPTLVEPGTRVYRVFIGLLIAGLFGAGLLIEGILQAFIETTR